MPTHGCIDGCVCACKCTYLSTESTAVSITKHTIYCYSSERFYACLLITAIRILHTCSYWITYFLFTSLETNEAVIR